VRWLLTQYPYQEREGVSSTADYIISYLISIVTILTIQDSLLLAKRRAC